MFQNPYEAQDQQGQEYAFDKELDLLPPSSLNYPLWRSLLSQVMERISPERLPPLHITSEPVDVGMLTGDAISLPWYRTVFVNLGNVIAPETLPPLQLESRPVDVGDLISDQMSVLWFRSLLSSLRDKISPEKLPPLHMSSAPVEPGLPEDKMQLPRWSNLITTPKLFLPDRVREGGNEVYRVPIVRPLPPPPKPTQADIDFHKALVAQRTASLRNSKVRQVVWVGVVLVEVGFLLGEMFVK